MQIKVFPIGDLVPDSANARKHGERNIEAIMDSIREFGQYQPIVIQKSTRRILAGNGRFEALKRLGAEDVQCVEVDVDNITATRLALADNRTAELAEWDFEILQTLLGEVGNGGLPGWTAEEIDGLLGASPDDFSDSFSLPDEDAPTVKQWTFVFSAEQISFVKDVLSIAENRFKDSIASTEGTSMNGTLLYRVCKEWAAHVK